MKINIMLKLQNEFDKYDEIVARFIFNFQSNSGVGKARHI